MLRLAITQLALLAILSIDSLANASEIISSPANTISASVGGNGDSAGAMISADGKCIVFVSSAENLVTNDFNGFLDIFIYNRETRKTILVSSDISGVQSANGDSYEPVISDDGRYVLFTSRASNLVTNDFNQKPDIFVRDMVEGKTRLVTENPNGKSSTGTPYNALFSANAKKVVFESSDSDLVPGDVNRFRDLFITDLTAGRTTMITWPSQSGIVSGEQDFEPAISDDGERIAYKSVYPNLVRNDGNSFADVFLWDGTTNILISAATTGVSANAASDSPMISGDGRYVAFHSRASNLVPGVTSGTNWFIRDVDLQKTALLSTNSPIFDLDERATLMATNLPLATRVAEPRTESSDARFRLITKVSSQVQQVYLHDRLEGSDLLISSVPDTNLPGNGPSHDPQFIGAGDRTVLFLTEAAGISGGIFTQSHFVLKDLDTLQTTLVTKSYKGTPANMSNNGVTGMASSSADGHWIVYQASAADLVTNTTRSVTSIYLYDATTQSNQLVSVDETGINAPSGESFLPYVSLDGRFVIFSSRGTNLVEGLEDTNNADDLFLRDLAAQRTMPITVALNGTNTPSAPATAYLEFNPALSADGRYVAFQSASQEIAGNDTNGVLDIFVRDTVAGSNILISVTATGESSGNGPSYSPLISEDGRFVAFRSRASNLVPNGTSRETVYLRDLVEGTTTVLPGKVPLFAPGNSTITIFGGVQLRRGFLEPTSFSTDARYEAYLSNANGARTNNSTNLFQVYLTDRQLGTTNLVSGNASGPAGWCDASVPSITQDGRFVVFESMDGGLVPNDHNHAMDVFLFDSSDNHIELVSAHDPALPGNSGNGYSTFLANGLSGNGQRVVFTSWATNLVANDTNDAQDVFIYDFASGSNRLVSANQQGITPAAGFSTDASISSDGTKLAFASLAGDIVEGDTNKAWDVFVQDLQTGLRTLASQSWQGTPLSRNSYSPSLSSDGRYVAFVSDANNVTEVTDLNNASDVFVRDMAQGITRLVSISNSLTNTANGASSSPVISPDGRHIAFITKAKNLSGDSPSGTSLYLYDLEKSTAKLLGTTKVPPVFSTNSSLLLFESSMNEPQLGDTNNKADVFLYDLKNDRLELISINSAGSSGNGESHIGAMTPNGSYVVFTSRSSDLAGVDSNATSDVFLRDHSAGATILISRNRADGASGNASSDFPVISADGKHIAFRSSATDLAEEPTRALAQIYVFDMSTEKISLVSRSRSGSGSANAFCGAPLINADGSSIFFKSFASDLASTKESTSQDIYFYRISSSEIVDTDGDGIEDTWERQFFGDLSHTGETDSDNDGVSDLNEFKAGTNPLDPASVFRGTALNPTQAGTAILQWGSIPGRHYQVQYKDDLNLENWINLNQQVTATSASTEVTDLRANESIRRYYRIIVLP